MFKKKERKSCFKPGKCLHCVNFIRISKVQKKYNVFKHYPQGKSIALEDRHYHIGGNKIYEIDSIEHADHYDFEDSDDIIDSFLLNVHSKFVLLEQEMIVKYDFKLQNI